MRRMRKIAKQWICLGFWIDIGSIAAEGLVALVVLVTVIWSGNNDPWMELVAKVVGTLLLLGFVRWVAKDARKSSKRMRLERLERKAEWEKDRGTTS